MHESILEQNSRIYLIVDGLDELATAQLKPALRYLQELKSLEFLHLLSISRTQRTIQKRLVELDSWPMIVIDKAAVRDDIELIVSRGIESSELAELDGDLQLEIKETLLTRGEGM